MKIKHVAFNGIFTECTVAMTEPLKGSSRIVEDTVIFVPTKSKKYKHGWKPKDTGHLVDADHNRCARAIKRALKARRVRAVEEIKNIDKALSGRSK